jgi:hypothetical protein
MPHEIEEVFGECGTPLFPRSAAAPDLLLRMFPQLPVRVRGRDLADVLAPAYERLAADDPGPGEAG